MLQGTNQLNVTGNKSIKCYRICLDLSLSTKTCCLFGQSTAD